MKTIIAIAMGLMLLHSQIVFCQSQENFIPCKDVNGNDDDTSQQPYWFNYSINHVFQLDSIEKNKFLDIYLGKSSFGIPESNAPWAGNYFKSANNGIAYRWNSQKRIATIVDTAQLKWTSGLIHNINYLSPIEKYDLYQGNFDFKASKKEICVRGIKRPNPSDNDGYCNGVRAAGVLSPEPIHQFTVTSLGNPSIKITFYPYDIKALLAADYFYVENYGQIGCPWSSNKQYDIRPEIFDIALRFLLGENNKCFFIDTDTSNRKMNQTIIGYDRKIIDSAKNTFLKEFNISMTIYTLEELKGAKANGPTKKFVAAFRKNLTTTTFRTHKYKYKLITDFKNNILSGQWLSMPPDILWFASGKGFNDSVGSDQISNPYLIDTAVMDLLKMAQ